MVPNNRLRRTALRAAAEPGRLERLERTICTIPYF
jgi:hypothetical protein